MATQILSHVEMDAELSEILQTDMSSVESLLSKELSKGEDFLTEKSKHLFLAGGKRFRPIFTLLCGYLGTELDKDALITAAAIVELVHLATLYHDDVIDEAAMRRGVPSANFRWGNTVAILIGDNLFARASFLLAHLGPEAMEFISDTVSILVTGQLRETLGSGDMNPVEHYLKVIEEKTASLIAAGGVLAGVTTKAPDEQIKIQNQLGYAIGMAFQISDDIIDISSNTQQSGKKPGTDLHEGVFTLPILYALQGDSPQSAELRKVLTGPIQDDELIHQILELISQTEGIERAKNDLFRYTQQAEKLIEQLPDSMVRDALYQLNTSTILRVG